MEVRAVLELLKKHILVKQPLNVQSMVVMVNGPLMGLVLQLVEVEPKLDIETVILQRHHMVELCVLMSQKKHNHAEQKLSVLVRLAFHLRALY